MPQNTYKAQLNYYDSSWGWGNEGTASQGKWSGTGTRTGVLYFPGLAALKDKIINSVKLSATTGQTGYGLTVTKTVNLYNSASQGGIKISLNANHKTGSVLGSCKAPMWDNTKTFDVNFLAAPIAAGKDTYCIYNGTSETDYLKWTAVTLTVNWQEPATQPTADKNSLDLGTPLTVSLAPKNSAYTHTLRYKCGNETGTIGDAKTSSRSITWTPPLSLAAQMPSATAGTCTIYADTYSGSTLLGTKSTDIALTIPSSVVPSAGTLTAAVADDTSGTGLYVKGMGKAKLTLSGAAGVYGSSIKSYTITGGGWTASNQALTTGVLQSAGSITFTGTVTDSRGRTASVTCTISVIDYVKPGVAECKIYRCDAAGNAKSAGTYIAIEISASFSAIKGNELQLTAKYKKQSDESYGAAVTLTNNGKTILGGGEISASATYDVLVTAADNYNSIEFAQILATKDALLSFRRNLGIAIGKICELAGWLDIQFSTRVRGDLQVDGRILNGIYALGAKENIPQDANINTYTATGTYAVASNAIAQKISNLPAAQAGTLITENITYSADYDWSAGYLLQTYKTYLGTAYVRRSSDAGATWTEWITNADSGWITPTLESGFIAYSADQAVQYRKVDKLIEIRGSVKPTANIAGSATNYLIFTLPEGYRPNKQINIMCHGSSWYNWLLTITSGGEVNFSRYSNGTGYTNAPTSAWLPMQATFFID